MLVKINNQKIFMRRCICTKSNFNCKKKKIVNYISMHVMYWILVYSLSILFDVSRLFISLTSFLFIKIILETLSKNIHNSK